MNETPLASLICTVFDTETTGLRPSTGDAIVSIAGVRVRAGRVAGDEIFSRLVNPRRSIPARASSIHGITDSMVRDEPDITTVLPEFASFAGETVLVAHNAPFDMRFLAIHKVRTGIRFQQPVLDTMLLANVLRRPGERLSLDAQTRKFGIQINERHSAHGDAYATALLFVQLLPLLEEAGVRTLGDALNLSVPHWYQRLQY